MKVFSYLLGLEQPNI